MILPLFALGTVLLLMLPGEQPPSEHKCKDRRKSKSPYCLDDPECTWVSGSGCVDKDKGRYFKDDSIFEGEEKREEKMKFCRCAHHIMASSDYKPKRIYQICATSVGTTTGGRPCLYDWYRIPEDEIRGYVISLEKRGEFPQGTSRQEIKSLRKKLHSWYEKKSQK